VARASARSLEFRVFVDRVEAEVPADLDVHLIVDNDGRHNTEVIKRRLAERLRLHVHFTPIGASWLDLIERWFAGPDGETDPSQHPP